MTCNVGRRRLQEAVEDILDGRNRNEQEILLENDGARRRHRRQENPNGSPEQHLHRCSSR